ncbi:MAG: peptide chain release factor 2 [Synergistaceae bacterium]|nr:peptide chain release factor 2 [Synergistaceae bacterium]MBP9975861.1 peptide chain release factor 2 [Synergistaceae bacterium]MCE5183163.1 peptide chain release factor 2 [Synergistaceae bacterium]MDD4751580.1 peptide chain release factor 2 [Synergistaceae bacterium]MDD4838994.1 peptide chain release factor 2 [Synergistaceae bacterium]
MVVLPISTVMTDLRSSFDELRESLDPSTLKTRIEELQKLTVEPDFWSSDNAHEVNREISLLQSRLDKIESSQNELLELEAIAELLSEVDDPELNSEFYARSSAMAKSIEAYQILVLLDGEYDSGDAIMTIHAGAGGLDSQDWAEMLYRMYMRWAESNKFTVKLIDELPDQEAGIKSVTISINGDYAYGYLKGEQGVHRLVRISPFDSAKRRHTSFASIEVMPVLPDSVEVEIRPEDLKVDTFRSSGAGGQYVNMTDSAIRITHMPSGIVVSCQTERSQHMNRATAMQVLRSKLFEKTLRERQAQLDNIQGEKRTVAWGSQIRSYTLQPFQLIKDHRSGCEIGNVQAVLDGDLDELIMSYLRYMKTGKLQNGSDN